MTDETSTMAAPAEPAAPRRRGRPPRGEASQAETSAAERLAALEEKLFGDRAARVNGKIERGHGSLFRRLSADEQRHYLALDAEVEAEAKVALARTALTLAENALAAAEARCEACKGE
jgi:hypothetical protein